MRALQGLIQIYVDHFGSFRDRGSRPRWSSHRFGPSPGDHSRVTDSRNQADPRGHERTLRSSNSSTGVHQRTRRGTHGYAMSAALDREAQVQIPGPRPKSAYDSGSQLVPRRGTRITAGSDFGAEVKSYDHEPPPPFTLERLCKWPAVGSRPDAGKHRDGWVYGKHSTQHCRQGHRFSYHFGSYHVPRPLQAHPGGAARQVFPPSTPSWHE